MPLKREFYYKKVINFLKAKEKSKKEVNRKELETFIIAEYGVKNPSKVISNLKKSGYIKEDIEYKVIINLIQPDYIVDVEKDKLQNKLKCVNIKYRK